MLTFLRCRWTGVVTRQSGAINWSSIEVGQVITIDGTQEGIIESIDLPLEIVLNFKY